MRSRLHFAVLATLGGVLAGCTATSDEQSAATAAASSDPIRIYPIVARFGDTGDILSGGSVDNPIEGVYGLRARSRASGLTCDVMTSAPALLSRADGCLGQEGTILFSCENGREVETTWQAESCTSGYGVGTDSRGYQFDYAFGMPRTVALTHFGDIAEYEMAEIAPEDGGLAAIVVPPGGIGSGGSASLPTVEEPQTGSVSAAPSAVNEDGYFDKLEISTSGTGFFVTGDGYLLTNYHVVEGAALVGVRIDDSLLEASIIDLDAANDLALLKVDAVTKPLPLPPVPAYQRGGEVMTLGFPFANINGYSQKATFGRINDLSGLAGDPRYLQMDVPTQPGNSGGPLFNTRGEVIGIVTSTTNDAKALEILGTIPQNMNYAVKADYARPMISKLESTTTPAGALEDLSFSDLAEEYESSVVLILSFQLRQDLAAE